MREVGEIKYQVVLVGAGNTHLQIVKRFGMKGRSDVRLILISDFGMAPYSGMIPGCLSGAYTAPEISIDLIRLCNRAGVQFVQGKAAGLNRNAKRVLLEDGREIAYDKLSFNVGSKPYIPDNTNPNSISVKPLGSLLKRLSAIDTELEASETSPKPFRLVVVGGGASGCELAFALRQRFSNHDHFEINLLVSGSEILVGFARSVATKTLQALKKKQIEVSFGAKIVEVGDCRLRTEDGKSIEFSKVLWATHATPLDFIAKLGLETDDRGFIRVHDDLRTITDSDIFGTGDCISLASHPNLPKAGVFAVREGPYLWKNLFASLEEKPLTPYRPQSLYLFLLNCSDGTAVMSYGRLTARGSSLYRWKDFIDRKWMNKLQEFYTQPMKLDEKSESAMRCGGCGSKVPASVLDKALKRIDLPTRPEVLIDSARVEDASVHRPPKTEPDTVEVQSLDFFKKFIDDPYVFGQVAATNALSDLYAMNATPMTALAVVTLPLADPHVQEEDLYQVLSGASKVLGQHNVALTGGHTSESADSAIGLSVTGYAKEGALFRKDKLQPGDALILTKPLGTGALLAAMMRGELNEAYFSSMLQSMLHSNQKAAEIFSTAGVIACTDITGFGLAGHLMEMLSGTSLHAHLETAQLPILPGFTEMTERGIYSTLHPENRKISTRVSSETPNEVVYDPQTSGGLLAGVSPDNAAHVLHLLQESHHSGARILGHIRQSKPMIDPLSDRKAESKTEDAHKQITLSP